MAASVSIIVKAAGGKTLTDLAILKPDSSLKVQALHLLQNYLAGVQQGQEAAIVDIDVAGAAVTASATVTCASVQAADTVTINGAVITAVTGAAAADQFDRSLATDTLVAAALAAAINASVTARITACVIATSSGAVVTVSSISAGLVGNVQRITTSNGSRLAVTGSGFLAGGTGVSSTAGKTSYTFGG